MKQPINTRYELDTISQIQTCAESEGISTGEWIRNQVAKAAKKQADKLKGKCPTCGHKRK